MQDLGISEATVFVVEVSLVSFLTATIQAAVRVPFAAMVIPLARCGDMQTPEQDIEHLWVSIHDVTGNSILVACPDGRASGGIVDWEDEVVIQPRGLRFTDPDSEKFSKAFIANMRIGHEQPRAPEPAHWSNVAWTTATRQIAELFGMSERDIPALVVVDVHSKVFYALRMEPEVNVYQLCKAIIERLGEVPRRIDEARTALQHAICKQQAVANARNRARKVLHDQFAAAAKRLEHEPEVSPSQQQCASLLRSALDNAEHLPILLSVMRQVREDSRRLQGRGSKLSRQLGRLIDRVENLGDSIPALEIPRRNEYEAAKSDVARARSRLQEVAKLENLGQVVQDLGRELYGTIEILHASPREPLRFDEWRVVNIQPKDRPPVRNQGQSASQSRTRLPETAVRRESRSRKRAKVVFIVAAITSLLTAAAAILTNLVTGGSGSSWLWFVLGFLVLTTAGSAGLVAKWSIGD